MQFKVSILQQFGTRYIPATNVTTLNVIIPTVLPNNTNTPVTLTGAGMGQRVILKNNVEITSDLALDEYIFNFQKFKCNCGGKRRYLNYKVNFLKIG